MRENKHVNLKQNSVSYKRGVAVYKGSCERRNVVAIRNSKGRDEDASNPDALLGIT
jgi:hypothetical protein